MEQFSKSITVGNEARLFQFTRMRNFNGEKYFVTSADENNKPISFSLKEKEKEGWKLMPGALRWLYEIEPELSDAIQETQLS